MPVRPTNKVLIDRSLRHDAGDDIKDWALEMMEHGYESEHLIILAGLTPPFESYQIDMYFTKDLKSGSAQYYWEGATLNNFDEIVGKVFKKWMKDFETCQRPNKA